MLLKYLSQGLDQGSTQYTLLGVIGVPSSSAWQQVPGCCLPPVLPLCLIFLKHLVTSLLFKTQPAFCSLASVALGTLFSLSYCPSLASGLLLLIPFYLLHTLWNDPSAEVLPCPPIPPLFRDLLSHLVYILKSPIRLEALWKQGLSFIPESNIRLAPNGASINICEGLKCLYACMLTAGSLRSPFCTRISRGCQLKM